jgi:hypothetical protein
MGPVAGSLASQIPQTMTSRTVSNAAHFAGQSLSRTSSIGGVSQTLIAVSGIISDSR